MKFKIRVVVGVVLTILLAGCWATVVHNSPADTQIQRHETDPNSIALFEESEAVTQPYEVVGQVFAQRGLSPLLGGPSKRGMKNLLRKPAATMGADAVIGIHGGKWLTNSRNPWGQTGRWACGLAVKYVATTPEPRYINFMISLLPPEISSRYDDRIKTITRYELESRGFYVQFAPEVASCGDTAHFLLEHEGYCESTHSSVYESLLRMSTIELESLTGHNSSFVLQVGAGSSEYGFFLVPTASWSHANARLFSKQNRLTVWRGSHSLERMSVTGVIPGWERKKTLWMNMEELFTAMPAKPAELPDARPMSQADLIKEALEGQDVERRFESLQCLRIRVIENDYGAVAVDALGRALNRDREIGLGICAAEALMDIGPEAATTIAQCLDSTEGNRRLVASQALIAVSPETAQQHAPKIVSSLLQAFNADSASLLPQEYNVATLQRVKYAPDYTMGGSIVWRRPDCPIVNERIVAAFRSLDSSGVKELATAVQARETSDFIRGKAALVLGELGPSADQAVPALMEQMPRITTSMCWLGNYEEIINALANVSRTHPVESHVTDVTGDSTYAWGIMLTELTHYGKYMEGLNSIAGKHADVNGRGGNGLTTTFYDADGRVRLTANIIASGLGPELIVMTSEEPKLQVSTILLHVGYLWSGSCADVNATTKIHAGAYALHKITGLDLGTDPVSWRNWWSQHHDRSILND